MDIIFVQQFLKIIKMTLRKSILTKINNNQARLRLAAELNVSENTIRNYINGNSDQLTLAAALKVIREVTGLDDDQILVENKAKVTA